MNVEEYFQFAIKQGLHKSKSWMISAFSVVADNQLTNINVVGRITGLPVFFSQLTSKWEKIDGGTKSPLYAFRETCIATPELCSNLNKPVETTRGRLLFNLLCLVNSFGNKIPYINGKIELEKIENSIADKLTDDPAKGAVLKEDVIYVFEYKKFINSLYYLTNFTQIAVWALTKKLITPPPGIDKVRDKLLLEYKGDLSDPIVLAKFESELLKLDSEYLKDDPGGQFFQSGGKSRNIVRKRLFLTYGAEPGLTEKRTRRPVVASLKDGWKPEDMPALVDAMRAGSYNRGKRTALGGELTKWLFRASTGLEMIDGDCGTKMGKITKVTDINYKYQIRSYYIDKGKPVLIADEDMAKSLIGKTIMTRSPLFCHASDNNFCSICVGKAMAENKDGISIAIAEIGSMFLLLKMKQMHGKALTTAHIDLNNTLS